MAIIDPWNIPIDVNTKEYDIKGNMIKAELVLSDYELMKINPPTFEMDVKQQLIQMLMQEIFKHKCIEFTKMEDLMRGATSFRARMFVVPDDQVRILRVSQKNNNG
jgi:hypothetical protein